MGYTSAGTSKLVARLEEKGLITRTRTRTRGPEDGRVQDADEPFGIFSGRQQADLVVQVGQLAQNEGSGNLAAGLAGFGLGERVEADQRLIRARQCVIVPTADGRPFSSRDELLATLLVLACRPAHGRLSGPVPRRARTLPPARQAEVAAMRSRRLPEGAVLRQTPEKPQRAGGIGPAHALRIGAYRTERRLRIS